MDTVFLLRQDPHQSKPFITMTTTDKNGPPTAPNQAVLFPAYTGDYRVAKGEIGYGLFATRKIKKGTIIMDENSLEFSFADVVDGEMLLLDRYKKASKHAEADIPQYLPVTREMLLRTHGVPCLYPDPTDEASGGIIRWRLEVPGMLVNHSCDPNISDFPPCSEIGEGYATRTIKKGDELTFDYVLQYYDKGPFFEECLCGSTNCRGKMMGFQALSDEEKERLLPAASKAVQAMYLADIGKGPPIKFEQFVFPPRVSSSPSILRLVCPPPSCALADVEVKRNDSDEGNFALYASKDFCSGKMMYEFWNQTWPDAPKELDMVFASSIIGGNDPPEGTLVRIKASNCATKNKNDLFLFSGWQLLTQHSCDPNVVIDKDDDNEDYDSDEELYWCEMYAVKDIKAGDPLTTDFNCLLWDRTESDGSLDACKCRAEKCAGTVRGFKFLSREAQEERKAMSWKHASHGGKKKVTPGEALSAHVRAMWRKDPEQHENAPESDSDDDSSSSSSDNE